MQFAHFAARYILGSLSLVDEPYPSFFALKMMACGAIKFLLPPSAIHHSVYCNFFNKREKSLVVAGLNFVQVYRLNVAIQPGFPVGYDDPAITETVRAQTAASPQPMDEHVPEVGKLTTPPVMPVDDFDDEDLYAPTIPTPAPARQQPVQVRANIHSHSQSTKNSDHSSVFPSGYGCR